MKLMNIQRAIINKINNDTNIVLHLCVCVCVCDYSYAFIFKVRH